MNAVLVLAIGVAVLLAGYIFYGKWLSEQWGVDDTKETPTRIHNATGTQPNTAA